MTATSAPTIDLAAILDVLHPMITEHRNVDAERRCISSELADALADAGLFKLLVPRALGGLQLDPLDAAAIVEAVSRIDGSAGWCVMIGAQAAWYASFLPEAVAAEMIAHPRAKLAGALKPTGAAVPVDGGYQVRGRWSLASGAPYADHFFGTCVVEASPGDDGPRRPPVLRVAFVPASKTEVLDTWRSAGLRATGSHDFVVDGVVVPADHTLPFPVLGASPHDGPLYRDGYQNLVYVLQAAQALGVASSALDSFCDLATTKTRWGAEGPLREQPVVQAQFAGADARVRSARAWLWEVVSDVWDTTCVGAPPSTEQRVRLRLAITHAITIAAEAADVLQRAAGSSTVYEDHPLRRQFEDLRTALAHVQATPTILETTGAMLLGADSTPSPALI